jgi:hypothetical protein
MPTLSLGLLLDMMDMIVTGLNELGMGFMSIPQKGLHSESDKDPGTSHIPSYVYPSYLTRNHVLNVGI